MRTISLVIAVVFVAILISCLNPSKPEVISNYPVSAKVDTVDTYFGVEVADPYRWMENDTSKATADWVNAQNEVTFGFLNKITYRESIKERLLELNNYEKLSSPFRQGEYYYFYKNTG
ncbi:MAG: S9 family peptidase, partial [Cyclobacteriaceae bacterium]|nr:S9 family peptidase [Cyclobacteriaceae bacterium]